MEIKHTATDIKIKSNVEEYKTLESSLLSLFDEATDFYLLLSLYGYNRKNSIELDTNDGTNNEHSFGRVVYQGNPLSMHSNFGFITVLDNLDKPYNETVHELAFAKMNENQKSYQKLPNVQTFYKYLLGGIKPLHEDVFDLGVTNSINDLATNIYSLIVDEEDYEDLEMISTQLQFELGLIDHEGE